MNNATDLYSLAPHAAQQLIVQTATDIGFDAGNAPTTHLRPATSHVVPIFPVQFIPLYRQCMTALYRASTSPETSEHPNKVPTCDEVELFCACLINCEDLEEVITKAIRFTQFFNNRGESIALETGSKETYFQMNTHNKDRSTPALLCDLFGLGFFNKLFSWLIGEPLQISRVDMVYKPLIASEVADHIVGGPVRFESAHNALSFSTEMMRRPVVRRHRELSELLQAVPFELVAELPRQSTSNRIERIFRKLMAEGGTLPSLERIAQSVGQPISTLRRHLAQQNTSYQGIIDRCRMEQALELLRDTAMTVDNIAAHLGYSASSSFSRAFKSWMGCAPSTYRQMLGEHTTRSPISLIDFPMAR